MTEIEQAARRAAEKCYDAHNSAVHSGFARASESEFTGIIAAEFATLQERLKALDAAARSTGGDKMTDAEVVETLARFMGWIDVHESCVNTYGRCGAGGRMETVPPYFTSYDAIAEVWRKALGEWSLDFIEEFSDSLLSPSGLWWVKTPTQHAYALAKEIKETGSGSQC